MIPFIAIGFLPAIILHVFIYLIVKLIIWQSGVS